MTLLAVVLLAVAVVAINELSRHRTIGRLRARLNPRFDEAQRGPQLDRYRAVLHDTFGASWPPREVLHDFAGERTPEATLEAAVRIAAKRLEVNLGDVQWSFADGIRMPNMAGCAQWPATSRVEIRGDAAIVTPLENPGKVWKIKVLDRYRNDPEQILSIVAHELAHVALLSRGVRLPDTRENEELTDAAAALAGFGPLMIRLRSKEHLSQHGRVFVLSRRTPGYLESGAIAYLLRPTQRV